MQNTPRDKRTLLPRKTINSCGSINYSEGFQAWNTIRLKKELFEEFPQLKEKSSKFSYEISYHRSTEEFEKALKKMIKEKLAIPMLMWIYKENS